MAGDWKQVALEDVADEVTVGYVGPMASEYVDSGVPFLRSQNVEPLRINGSDLKFITPEFHQRIRNSRLSPGDVVIVRTGKPGACSVIPDWLGDANCSDLVIIRCGEHINNRFLAYYVNTVASQHVAAHLVGAVQQHFNVGSARTMRIKLPPLSEQRALAHILGTLDDKIELNRRMNETLEATAQALFKSWFVDFDPVRAKAEGRDLGLPKEIADLFPDSFEDSELGEIPEGWRVGTLGAVCQKPQYGFTASAKAEPVGPKFLRITDINKLPWIEWSSVPHCEMSKEEFEQYRIRRGDILIARMADPGHGVMIEEDVEGVFASYLIRFRPRDVTFDRYLQYWLRSASYWKLVAARQAGTTRASLNAQVIGAFQLMMPSREVADAFKKKVASLRSKVIANVVESRPLATLRDTLLPKLISGEIRVKDAERFLKARGL
jgi:type I restriction enzyme S subunit